MVSPADPCHRNAMAAGPGWENQLTVRRTGMDRPHQAVTAQMDKENVLAQGYITT